MIPEEDEDHHDNSDDCDDKQFDKLNKKLSLRKGKDQMSKALSVGIGKGLQSKKSMFSLDETTVVKKGVSRTYTSRRSVKFDDNNSGDEGGGTRRDTKYKDTGAISYRDTKGNETVLQPNSRLIRYKDIF